MRHKAAHIFAVLSDAGYGVSTDYQGRDEGIDTHSSFRAESLRQLDPLLQREKSWIGTKTVEFRFHLHEYQAIGAVCKSLLKPLHRLSVLTKPYIHDCKVMRKNDPRSRDCDLTRLADYA